MGSRDSLENLRPEQVAAWAEAAQRASLQGQVNQRIPALACCQSDWFSFQIDGRHGPLCKWGSRRHRFSLMSVIKPFLLLYCLEHYGAEQVFSWVGMAASNAPFNDLGQLQADGGHPRNPMINSGALMLAAHLPGHQPVAEFCSWLNQQARCQLELDAAMLGAVRQGRRDANLALLDYLSKTGRIQRPQQALDCYEKICCFSGQIDDLARLGHLLTFELAPVKASHRRAVCALMLTCGLYEASSRYAVTVGLPMKSGISGALLAIVPGQGVAAIYAPALDAQGNSVAGLALVTQLADRLGLSVFG